MYILSIKSTPVLIPASQSFYSTCSTAAAQLGLTAANLTEINNAVNGLNNSYAAMLNAREAYKNAVVARDIQQKALHTVLSKWAKTFDANLAIPDNLLAQLQLPPHHPTGTSYAPTQPQDLVAKADAQGNVKLTWKRNGNPTGTIFLIEAQLSEGGPWNQIGAVSGAKFEYKATLGSYIGFRVTATRKGQSSTASDAVFLWAGSGAGEAVQLKVA